MPRFTGFGPVCSPPFWPGRSHYSGWPGSSPTAASSPNQFSTVSCRRSQSPAASHRAAVSSRSRRSRSRVPWAANATGTPPARRRRSPRVRLDPGPEDDRLWAWAAPVAVMARSLSRGRWGQGVRRSWPAIISPRRGFETGSWSISPLAGIVSRQRRVGPNNVHHKPTAAISPMAAKINQGRAGRSSRPPRS